eukprot:Filipodium_phascolosomae@DN3542_c0_g1_i1.p1
MDSTARIYRDANLAFPTRKDLMSLDVIHASDLPPEPIPLVRESMSLKNRDIEGSEPSYPWKRFLNRPDKDVDLKKISGSVKTNLFQNRPDLILNTRDIEKAYPVYQGFLKTSRNTNPLVPEYCLPKAPPFISPQIKFSGRHTNYVDDIEGACAHKHSPADSPKIIPINDNTMKKTQSARNFASLNSEEASLQLSSVTKNVNLGDSRRPRVRNTNPLSPRLAREKYTKLRKLGLEIM